MSSDTRVLFDRDIREVYAFHSYKEEVMTRRLRYGICFCFCLAVAGCIGLILLVFENETGIIRFIFPLTVLPLLSLLIIGACIAGTETYRKKVPAE